MGGGPGGGGGGGNGGGGNDAFVSATSLGGAGGGGGKGRDDGPTESLPVTLDSGKGGGGGGGGGGGTAEVPASDSEVEDDAAALVGADNGILGPVAWKPKVMKTIFSSCKRYQESKYKKKRHENSNLWTIYTWVAFQEGELLSGSLLDDNKQNPTNNKLVSDLRKRDEP